MKKYLIDLFKKLVFWKKAPVEKQDPRTVNRWTPPGTAKSRRKSKSKARAASASRKRNRR